jgi:asparagine synthase (glutamine-hydrolysing)
MCGIVGIWGGGVANLRDTALRATQLLHHRGPNAAGVWIDQPNALALGHTRLAIVDLSLNGAQPMRSASGRYVISFNGEVFNFLALQRELEGGYPFKGGSDTEVMLAAFERWGIIEATKRFVGMFAFAVWDRQQRELTLVRDRVGIKPLCYGWIGSSFVFSSELHALRAHPSWSGEVDRDSLQLMLEFGYVPTPRSAVKGIAKLEPGGFVTISTHERDHRIASPRRYWDAADVVERAVSNPLPDDLSLVIEQFEHLLEESIRLRMISDVPLGAFLSGGVDSSTVVGIMQKISNSPVRTFSIGFADAQYNEAHFAREVAQHLGTDHTELYVSDEDALALTPRLGRIYDEPFGDSSQIPTQLLSALTRQHVTVSLSGDGGDELFGGYSRYQLLSRFWSRISAAPLAFRRLLRTTGVLAGSGFWRVLYETLKRAGVMRAEIKNVGEKVEKIFLGIGEPTLVDFYYRVMRILPPGRGYVLGADPTFRYRSPPPALSDHSRALMMFSDLVSYLPDDILVKVDRASMSVALEARVPLLDHRLVEFAWRLPDSMRYRDGEEKWLLRQVLYRMVPRQLVERPKAGFVVPLDRWLRGPLREWADSLLDRSTLEREGVLNVAPVRELWESHRQGSQNRGSEVWNLLMLRAWLTEVAGRPLGNETAPVKVDVIEGD